MTAEQAIARSISHNEIVTVDDIELHPELSRLADDWTSQVVGDVRVTEYWGTTAAGDAWRVHVRQSVPAI